MTKPDISESQDTGPKCNLAQKLAELTNAPENLIHHHNIIFKITQSKEWSSGRAMTNIHYIAIIFLFRISSFLLFANLARIFAGVNILYSNTVIFSECLRHSRSFAQARTQALIAAVTTGSEAYKALFSSMLFAKMERAA
ncbi:MAG: hypothetical protein AAGA34_03935 [Pseudomonadota bacterium]